MQRFGRRAKELAEWVKEVGRPAVILRDGEVCNCAGCNHTTNLDVDHIKGKGAHPELKQEISNLQLLCRFPCHFNKTNGILCTHENY